MLYFLACLLTVLTEGAFFFACGRRDGRSLAFVACANVITNLLLNLILSLGLLPRVPLVYVLEALAVWTEYRIYEKAFGGSRRLFLQTLAANLLSYTAGLVLF